MNAMVIFDSKHGATADLAGRIAEKLGDGVSLVYLRDKGADRVDLGDCDLVVLGGPIYAGSWSKKAVAFARAREKELAGKTFAYFSSGMGVDEGIAQARAALPAVLADAAVAAEKFGGEIRWEHMNFLERAIIKAISGKPGDRTMVDTEAVDAFADRIMEAAKKRP